MIARSRFTSKAYAHDLEGDGGRVGSGSEGER